jgi:hypothetical protein
MDRDSCITLSLMADTKRLYSLQREIPKQLTAPPSMLRSLWLLSFGFSFVHVSTSPNLGAHSQKKKEKNKEGH